MIPRRLVSGREAASDDVTQLLALARGLASFLSPIIITVFNAEISLEQ